MLATLSPQQRYDLVVRRLAEVNGGQAIEEVFAAGKTPKTFWGKYFPLLYCIASTKVSPTDGRPL